MAFRGIGVMVVLLAVTVANKGVGVSAVIVYALAYSLSLGDLAARVLHRGEA